MIANEGFFCPKKITLNDFVKKHDIFRNFSLYIDKDYDEISQKYKNIVVGFVFVSHDWGLSEGVPIDIYNMLLAAEEIRQQVLQKGAKVYVLIGDHFAFNCRHENCTDKESIINKRSEYFQTLTNIVENLGISQHYSFVFSSDIVKTAEYIKIRRELEENSKNNIASENEDKHTQKILSNEKPFDGSNREYFFDQTAIFKYLFDYYFCGGKVGWSKAHQTGQIKKSTYDEPHFDRFYRDMYCMDKEKLSFVYVEPGYAVNDLKGANKEIPYTAPKKDNLSRILLKKNHQDGPILNPKLLSRIEKNVDIVQRCIPENSFLKSSKVDILKQVSNKNSVNWLVYQFKKLRTTPKTQEIILNNNGVTNENKCYSFN